MGLKFESGMLRSYFIAGTQDIKDPTKTLQEVAKQAMEAGITAFQYREKGPGSLSGEKRDQLAADLRDMCADYEIPFIVDDDVELAIKTRADGYMLAKKMNGSEKSSTKWAAPCLLAYHVTLRNKLTLPTRLPESVILAAGRSFRLVQKRMPIRSSGLTAWQRSSKKASSQSLPLAALRKKTLSSCQKPGYPACQSFQ